MNTPASTQNSATEQAKAEAPTEAKKAAPKKAAPKKSAKKDAIFISREKEPMQFSILGIRARRDDARSRLVFEVPAELVERFRRHHHVLIGRVQEEK